VSPAPTPTMMPAVFITASIMRALAVTGNPLRASWVAPMMPTPARSMTIPAVTTRDVFSSRPEAEAATAMSVATKPPAACW
jgi:hypothetical protein